jgi:DNA primase
MAFPVNLATKIRSQISISSVIAKKVKLKKKGKDFLGLCPFHQEKTPSFTVNDAKGLYYCFGCGAGGDVVKFVSETEKITYGEAIKKIAYDFNLELPKNHKTNHFLPRKYLILNTILQFFKQNLQNNLSAQQYLISRGLNEATINFFQLGFANNSYSDLVDLLLKQNFSTAEILETGIFGHKDNKIFNKLYSSNSRWC